MSDRGAGGTDMSAWQRQHKPRCLVIDSGSDEEGYALGSLHWVLRLESGKAGNMLKSFAQGPAIGAQP